MQGAHTQYNRQMVQCRAVPKPMQLFTNVTPIKSIKSEKEKHGPRGWYRGERQTDLKSDSTVTLATHTKEEARRRGGGGQQLPGLFPGRFLSPELQGPWFRL